MESVFEGEMSEVAAGLRYREESPHREERKDLKEDLRLLLAIPSSGGKSKILSGSANAGCSNGLFSAMTSVFMVADQRYGG